MHAQGKELLTEETQQPRKPKPGLLTGTLMPAMVFGTLGNFFMQIVLFITAWTYNMSLGRWFAFAITCEIIQFYIFFFLLVFYNYTKRKDYESNLRSQGRQ